MNDNIALTPEQARGITNLIGMVQAAHPLEDLGGPAVEDVLTAIAEPRLPEMSEGMAVSNYRRPLFDVHVVLPRGTSVDHRGVTYVHTGDGGALVVDNTDTGECHFYAPGHWRTARRVQQEVSDAD